MPIEVAGLNYYPVKGLQGIAARQAELTSTGLAYDRQWMIVMPNGRMVTQRQHSALARIAVDVSATSLLLSVGVEQLEVPLVRDDREQIRCEVSIWRDQFTALDEGAEAAAWLTGTLESRHPLRLVRMCPGIRRPQSNPDQLGAATSTGFADAAPILVTNTASLQALNDRLLERGEEPVGLDRFRSNIVLRGLDAFSEYQTATLVGPNQAFSIALCYPSERCTVITIDQQTGAKDPVLEPLATLREMNTAPGQEGAYFGQNARLAEGPGAVISVGDTLRLETLSPAR